MKIVIPPERKLLPVTAAELRQRMEGLLSDMAPRLHTVSRASTDRPQFTPIEPVALVEELHIWIGVN
jgi:hypothetical protein